MTNTSERPGVPGESHLTKENSMVSELARGNSFLRQTASNQHVTQHDSALDQQSATHCKRSLLSAPSAMYRRRFAQSAEHLQRLCGVVVAAYIERAHSGRDVLRCVIARVLLHALSKLCAADRISSRDHVRRDEQDMQMQSKTDW
jgi:hypothetical protein